MDNENLITSSSILYIEKISNNKTKIHTAQKNFEFLESISYFEKKLDKNFFRCSKNFLINLNKISRFQKEFVIINNQQIKIDKNKFKKLKKTLLDFLKIKV